VAVRGGWGLLSGLVGVGLLINAAMGRCYLYKLLGISTYKRK
jgi:hypothetical protein